MYYDNAFPALDIEACARNFSSTQVESFLGRSYSCSDGFPSALRIVLLLFTLGDSWRGSSMIRSGRAGMLMRGGRSTLLLRCSGNLRKRYRIKLVFRSRDTRRNDLESMNSGMTKRLEGQIAYLTKEFEMFILTGVLCFVVIQDDTDRVLVRYKVNEFARDASIREKAPTCNIRNICLTQTEAFHHKTRRVWRGRLVGWRRW
jgi:hypothetical protein